LIALDDAALARLVIAATAIPEHKRGAWLRRVARLADPSPQLAYYRRQRGEVVRVTLEAECDELIEFLHDCGLPVKNRSQEALAASLKDLFEAWRHGFLSIKIRRESV
jgi:hypothetical protein